MNKVWFQDHAWVIFFYYIIGFAAMVVMPHPALLLCAFVILLVIECAESGFIKMLRTLLMNLGLAVLIVVFNLLVNHRGPTTLLKLWGMRLTVESLLYGFQTALMFLCCIRLFMAFSRAMTDEKVMAMLSGRLPGLALVFSMILRLVPQIRQDSAELKKFHGISEDRSKKEKRRVFRVWRMLLTKTLEDGVIRSISMRDRGYGEHPKKKSTVVRRTSFYKKRFTIKDACLLLGSFAWFGLCLCIFINGWIYARYFPTLSIRPVDWYVFLLWGVFYGMPLLRMGKEEIVWHLSRRRIIDTPMPETRIQP